MEPSPQRLSDAERDAAIGMLREHFQAGRLASDEFDERMSAALRAKFETDIEPLFADLPDPRPTSLGASPYSPPGTSAPVVWSAPPPPVRTPENKALNAVRAALWPVAILGAFATGSWFWWIGGAIVISIVLGQLADQQKRPTDPPQIDS